MPCVVDRRKLHFWKNRPKQISRGNETIILPWVYGIKTVGVVLRARHLHNNKIGIGSYVQKLFVSPKQIDASICLSKV